MGKFFIMETTSGERKSFWKGFFCAVGCIVGFCLVAVMFFNIACFGSLFPKGLSVSEMTAMTMKMNALAQAVDLTYLNEYDREVLLDGAYKGYIDALEESYSTYYNPEEFASYMEGVLGAYSGVGLTVTTDEATGRMKIVEVQSGGPADGTEIRPGDLIMAVEDQDVAGMDMDSIVLMIKGEEGTKVNVTFCHEGEETPFTVTLTRATIEVETVRWTVVEEEIGYLAISGFDEVTVDQFKKALEELQKADVKGIIFDVRNNPGGRLDVVIDILDILLPEGIITYTMDKNGNRNELHSDADYLDIPMAVLTNGGSASASEVFAGALRDYEAATLVGTTTFGKGLVQLTTTFPDGSAVKLTSSRYYTPKGDYIHGVGIAPHIEIDLPADVTYSADLPYEEDIQWQTAAEAIKTALGQ